MDWRDIIKKDALFEKIYRLASTYMKTRDGELHVQIALNFAYRLLESTAGDKEVVIPAIILHDTGRSAIPQEKESMSWGPNFDSNLLRLHEIEGVKIARRILKKVAYDLSKSTQILQIIEGHDSRKNALSMNDKIVKDADRLSRYSRHGFWSAVRTFRIAAEEAHDDLQLLIEKWFFLNDSKEIARNELRDRNREIYRNES